MVRYCQQRWSHLGMPLPCASDNDWDSVIHTNLDRHNVIHPCIMPMISGQNSHCSVSGVMATAVRSTGECGKAGIIGALKALAIELAKRKITVTVHCTGTH